MGWFSEQLNKRKKYDEESKARSLYTLASSIDKDIPVKAIESDSLTDNAVLEIIRYFGFTVNEIETPVTITDWEEKLEYMLRPYGIMRRNVKLDEGWYRHAIGPMIGVLKESRKPVALIPAGMSGYDLIDYDKVKRFRINKSNEDLLDSDAICFYKPLPLRAMTYQDLFVFLRQQISGTDYVFYIIAIIVPILLGFFTPAFTMWIFNRVIPSGDKSLLMSLAVFMLGFMLCQLFMNMFKAVIKNRTITKLDVPLRAALMGRLISLKTGFFSDYSSGELATRIIQMEEICTTVIETIGSVGITAVFSLVYIIQAHDFAPELVGIALTVSLIDIGIVTFATILKSVNIKQYLYQNTKTGGLTYPLITGIEKIKISGAENRVFARWANQYAKETSIKYNPPLFVRIWPALMIASNAIGALMIYARAYANNIPTSGFYAFTTAFGMITAAFTLLVQMVPFMALIKPTFDLLTPILEAEPEENLGNTVVTSLQGNVEFRDVTFGYDKGTNKVLDNLSFSVSSGEYVAIVGKTGCGKSTIIRLMLGFETPQKGSIYYDKKDLKKLDLNSLRRKVGTALQNEKLFTGDIYSNITIAAPQIPLDQVWEAAEIAEIADDIREMPMEMHTFISEGNGGISGGQKQRLMIARAIVTKPRILIFDEATSALDNITQQKISRAIDDMKCTRIVIAHRLSTIRNCDRILVMDKGKIAEEGSYEELLARKGLFAELVERQRIDFED